MVDKHYIYKLNHGIQREHVTYKTRFGIHVAADLFFPKGMDLDAKHPGIVVGSPYEGVKEQGAGVWANELVMRGFVMLAFDYSFNGESGGAYRHMSSPEVFTEDFSAAIDYLGTRSYIDKDKLGAIGLSDGGSFALAAAQVDVRIKAICTASLADISARDDLYTPEERQRKLQEIAEQRWEDFESDHPAFQPIFPEVPGNVVVEGPTPLDTEFNEFYGTKRGFHPSATGGFTVTSEAAFMNETLLDHLDDISPRYVLMLAGENGLLRPLTEDIFAQLTTPNKELIIVPNARHIDLYDDIQKIPFYEVEGFFKKAFGI